MRVIVFVLVVLLSLTGCVAEAEKPVPESKDGPTKITLTSVDLFKGDGAKFLPFLGAMSGAINLRYEGNKPNANLDIDIWQNGKKVASSGSIGDLFFSSTDWERQEVEVIVSIDIVSTDGQDQFNQIKVSSGSSLATFTVPWDKKLSTRGMIYHTEPRTFNADESESVYVLGMQATSTNQMITTDFSPESLSRLEWALIFTLRFEKL
jgi:hypothetical protein